MTVALVRRPRAHHGWLVTLAVLAFLAPGAWFVTSLPPVPVAQALQLATVAAWLVVAGLGLVRVCGLDRKLVIGLGIVGGSVLVSYLAGGAYLPVAVYDLFADMPLVQWLAFPAVFALAASVRADSTAVRRALLAVLAAGAALAAAMAVQQYMTGGNHVFGSTAYSITALAPLVPVGLVAAASGRRSGTGLPHAGAVLVAAVLAFGSGSATGAVAAVFALLVSVAAHPRPAFLRASRSRAARIVAASLAGLLFAAVLLAQVPVLTGRWVNPSSVGSFDKNVVTRSYLWIGAERMFAERPILGFGPSGYRMHAAEYLDPEALQFGADVAGNIDPTVYSPQSPHSLLWEIATRLGAVGLLAFAAMLALWLRVLRDRIAEDEAAGGTARVTSSASRAGLGAAFLASLLPMMLNPVVFPIGLFAAVAAGLAVRPSGVASAQPVGAASRRPALTAAGVLVLVIALWLGFGQLKSDSAGSDDAFQSIANYEAALHVVPGEPVALRRLFETRLLVASDAGQVAQRQAEIDAAPSWMLDYAPNRVNFAAYSLAQAERTGRTDLSWEREMLSSAEKELPPIPSLVAEKLHLAVLAGDRAAIASALPDAHRWGRPYPYVESYIRQADEALSTAQQ